MIWIHLAKTPNVPYERYALFGTRAQHMYRLNPPGLADPSLNPLALCGDDPFRGAGFITLPMTRLPNNLRVCRLFVAWSARLSFQTVASKPDALARRYFYTESHTPHLCPREGDCLSTAVKSFPYIVSGAAAVLRDVRRSGRLKRPPEEGFCVVSRVSPTQNWGPAVIGGWRRGPCRRRVGRTCRAAAAPVTPR